MCFVLVGTQCINISLEFSFFYISVCAENTVDTVHFVHEMRSFVLEWKYTRPTHKT